MIEKVSAVSKYIFAILFVAALATFSWVAVRQLTTPAPVAPLATPSTQVIPEQFGKKKAWYEFTATSSGQVALKLLSENAEVETKDYGSAGQFVTSINGLAANNEYYWAFYVNDEYAQAGASQTILQKDDRIKFVYEAITAVK